MTIDKYTKFILTLIAAGILGLNFHLLKGNFIKDVYASNGLQQITICDENGYTCGLGMNYGFKVKE